MLIQKTASNIKALERFFQNLYRSVSGLAKVVLLSNFNPKLPVSKIEDCVVLGNGPSLKDTLLKNRDKLVGKHLIAVNNFVVSPEFKQLKPSYYVMLDPGYFLNKQRADVMNAFKVLTEETIWDMTLFAPYLYRRDKDLNFLTKNNPHIKIVFYNYTIVKGFDFLAFSLFKRNLAMPQFYNVLGVSVFLAINMGYKRVWVTGADHGWFNDIEVDDKNNLCRRDYHFYDTASAQPLIPIIDPISGVTQRIGDLFQALHKVFDSYYLLNRYTKYKKCNVYNASEVSYIDAFERKKL